MKYRIICGISSRSSLFYLFFICGISSRFSLLAIVAIVKIKKVPVYKGLIEELALLIF